jgi:hypothetical protein
MNALDVTLNLAAPTTGDIAGQGQGASMAQRGNPGVVGTVDPNSGASPTVANNFPGQTGNPIVAWVAVLVLLVALKFGAEHGAQESEFSSIRVGLWSFLVITIVAVLGLNFAKWVFGTWTVPGVSQLVLAA